MPNASILKIILLTILLLVAGCGTGSMLQPNQGEDVLAGLRLPDSPLKHVSPANSRDILLRVKHPSALNQLHIPGVELGAPELIAADKQIYRLQIPAEKSLLDTIRLLEQNSAVFYAEPNYSFSIPPYRAFRTQTLTPNDAKYGLQWNMRSSKINEAWDLSTGDKNLTIAVIDSGIDPNHPDLQDHMLPMIDLWNQMKGSDIYVNIFLNQTFNYGGKDGNGHGTHVTGIIAAVMNNFTGVAGVAGGGIKILPIKATDFSGNTDAAVLTSAFQTAVEKEVDLINISIGGPKSKSTRALEDAVQMALDRGIPVVAATGNESDRFHDSIQPVSVPAAYSGVIAVGAHTEFDRIASYSNGGKEVAIVAPGGGGRNSQNGEGQQIWSTWPTYQTFEFLQKRVTSTYYATTSGTSMACPHITGVAALLLSREPHLTPAQVRARLIATADDLEVPGFDTATGYGKLNALRALTWTAHDATD